MPKPSAMSPARRPALPPLLTLLAAPAGERWRVGRAVCAQQLRRGLAALALALWGASQPLALAAGYDGPLFDAHLHHNDDALQPYPSADVLARLQRNGVRAALVNSRPNEGTRLLAQAAAQRPEAGVTVVPFVRPYREQADVNRWFAEPATVALVNEELARGAAGVAYRGLGEFHLYRSADAAAPVARALMQLAEARALVVMGHVDDDAIDTLLSHTASRGREVTFIWAHTGIGGTPPERVRELLQRHPRLMGELSYRPGLTCDRADGGTRLCPPWRELIVEFADRFLIGSDTWTNARWEAYDPIMQRYRDWLGELPPAVARKVAWENGARLFGLELDPNAPAAPAAKKP